MRDQDSVAKVLADMRGTSLAWAHSAGYDEVLDRYIARLEALQSQQDGAQGGEAVAEVFPSPATIGVALLWLKPAEDFIGQKLYAIAPQATPAAVVVRHDEDGALDEVVGSGDFHLEQMDNNKWWMQLGPHMVTLTARGKISAWFGKNEADAALAAPPAEVKP